MTLYSPKKNSLPCWRPVVVSTQKVMRSGRGRVHFFSGCPQTWQSFQGLSLLSVISFWIKFQVQENASGNSDEWRVQCCNCCYWGRREFIFFLSFNILFTGSMYLKLLTSTILFLGIWISFVILIITLSCSFKKKDLSLPTVR